MGDSPLTFVSSPLQYAANLEAYAFPDTDVIVKVAKRVLYRS
jgi:pyruvate dehydrogenase E1 component beta subunit